MKKGTEEVFVICVVIFIFALAFTFLVINTENYEKDCKSQGGYYKVMSFPECFDNKQQYCDFCENMFINCDKECYSDEKVEKDYEVRDVIVLDKVKKDNEEYCSGLWGCFVEKQHYCDWCQDGNRVCEMGCYDS